MVRREQRSGGDGPLTISCEPLGTPIEILVIASLTMEVKSGVVSVGEHSALSGGIMMFET